MTRREIRESAFKIIFEKLFRDEPVEELYSLFEESLQIPVNEGIKEIVEGVTAHSDEIDKIISELSVKRQFGRIPKVNLAVLRIAFYEILYDEKTPENAAINEAVQLSQLYSQESDVSFVNGVLGAYIRKKSDGNAENV